MWIRFSLSNKEIKSYIDWIKANLKKGTYILNDYNNSVYFLHEEDLSVFTLVFGKIYTYIEDPTFDKLQKMLLHENAIEQYKVKYKQK